VTKDVDVDELRVQDSEHDFKEELEGRMNFG
jgi:hypothetical protein